MNWFRRKVILTVCLQIFFGPPGLADSDPRSVLLRAPEVNANDYATAIEADHRLQAFSEFWLNRNENLRRDLRAAYAKAQEAFLQAEMDEMRLEWEKVASFAPKADWSKKYRQIIQIAQMRRAQLSQTPAETELWLKNVLSTDAGFEPDPGLFQPPLVKTYHHLRSSMPRVAVAIGPASGFDFLLINGVAYSLDKPKKIFIPAGTVRATYISSRFAPVTRILAAKDIIKLRPEQNALVSGNCGAPLLNPESGFSFNDANITLMFDRNCVIAAQRSLEKNDGTKNLSPAAFAYSSPTSIESRFEGASEPSSKPFYKKPWFWIGTTVVMGGLFALSQASHGSSNSPAPTHTDGF